MARRLTAAQIDFDSWSRMAREDPAAFEQHRSALIEAMIRSADPERQSRLRRLQWRIDQERRRAGTPIAACMALSRMMWDQVYGPGGLLSAMDHLGQRWRGDARRGIWPPGGGAEILAFPRPAQPEARPPSG